MGSDPRTGPADPAPAAAPRSRRRRVGLPAVLRHRAFARMWAASTVSMFGSSLSGLVLPIVAYELTGSGTAFAAVMAANAIGMVLGSPIGGVLTDRGDRVRLLLVGDAFELVLVLALGLAVVLGDWQMLIGVSFLIALVSGTFSSAGPALRRDLVPDDERVQANSVQTFSTFAVQLVTPLLGAGIYQAAGIVPIVVVDAATFIASIALVLSARLTARQRRAARADVGAHDPAGAVPGRARAFLGELREGAGMAKRDGFVAVELAACMVAMLSNGGFVVAMIPWFVEDLGMPATTFGVVVSAVGGSAVVTTLVAMRHAAALPPARSIAIGSTAGMLGAACFLGTPGLPRLVVGCLLFGVINVLNSIGSSTIQQRRVPGRLQGRLASMNMLVGQVASLAGVVLAGVLVDAVGAPFVVHIFVGSMLVTAALAMTAVHLARRPSPWASELEAEAQLQRVEVPAPTGRVGDHPRTTSLAEGDLVTGA